MADTPSSTSPQRSPGPIREAACWVHARRPFFAMADIEENARRKAAGKKEIAALADRDRGRAPHRRAVRDRALDQWQERRPAKGCSPGAERAVGRRSASLYARAVRQALPRSRSGQGHELHAQALGAPSPASSTMAASASPTTPPKERCAASHWAESRGYSAGPIAEGGAPRPCIASSSPPR